MCSPLARVLRINTREIRFFFFLTKISQVLVPFGDLIHVSRIFGVKYFKLFHVRIYFKRILQLKITLRANVFKYRRDYPFVIYLYFFFSFLRRITSPYNIQFRQGLHSRPELSPRLIFLLFRFLFHKVNDILECGRYVFFIVVALLRCRLHLRDVF